MANRQNGYGESSPCQINLFSSWFELIGLWTGEKQEMNGCSASWCQRGLWECLPDIDRYIARSYKQNGKTWYEQRGGKRSAELFRKHPQTIVSNSSRKIAEAISAVRLEGSISWVVQVPLLCLVLRGIFSSGLEMEYRACLFCLQMAVGWSQRARGQNSHSEWSWPVGGAIWKIGRSSIGRNEKFHI